MKKLLGILVLGFLFSSNANAGVNEPGTGFLGKCTGGLKWEHKKLKKIYLEKDKKINVIIYASCTSDRWGWGIKKGKNLEALHKKAYKSCLRASKKWTPGEDCFLYAVNEEMVWKYDKAKESAKAKAKLTEATTELEKQTQIDKKPGTFFEDQHDVNDDHQIHFIYLLSSEGEDKELDINGWIEKTVNRVNDKFLKISARNKKSNGIGQQFKLDMTKEGKLDVTFVRMNVSKQRLDVGEYPTDVIYSYLRKAGFNNPKKVYASLANFKSKHGNSDGGEGGVPMMVVYIPAIKTYGTKDMDLVILHELFHAQGASYGCGKRTYAGGHVKGSDVLAKDSVKSSMDSNNNTYYRHDIEGCPDLAKSVFVTPTAEDSWDPFDVFCRQKRGNLTHKDLYSNFKACKANAR